LKDVVAGAALRERPNDAITIFKSNGIAVEDVICAGYVFEQGSKKG
jgi:ornithine cyclodeaminase/alanine dehydrogenase-like protein (mu-crystallin family)